MRTYLNTLRLLNRSGHMLLLSHFFIGMGYLGIYVVLFNLYLARLGYGTEFIGLVNGLAVLTYALLCVPAGLLGKQWGTRRSVMLGSVLGGIGFGLVPLAEFVPSTWQSAWILVIYSLAWGCAALYLVNHTPFLMGAAEEQARNHVFSLLIALMATATFLGSLLGGILPGTFAFLTGFSTATPEVYRNSLFVAAAIMALAVPVLLRTQEVEYRQQSPTEKVSAPAPYGFMLAMGLIILLRTSTEGAGKTFFNVYLDVDLQVPTVTIGTIMAFGQLLAIPGALLMPLMAERWGRERTVVLGLAGMALFMIPLALVPHWSAAGLGYMGMVGLAAMSTPAIIVYTQEMVSQAWRSTMSGVGSMALGIGLAWTAIGGGYIIAGFGFASLHWLGASLAALGAVLFAAYLALSARRARRVALT
jgi:MFS family permease